MKVISLTTTVLIFLIGLFMTISQNAIAEMSAKNILVLEKAVNDKSENLVRTLKDQRQKLDNKTISSTYMDPQEQKQRDQEIKRKFERQLIFILLEKVTDDLGIDVHEVLEETSERVMIQEKEKNKDFSQDSDLYHESSPGSTPVQDYGSQVDSGQPQASSYNKGGMPMNTRTSIPFIQRDINNDLPGLSVPLNNQNDADSTNDDESAEDEDGEDVIDDVDTESEEEEEGQV